MVRFQRNFACGHLLPIPNFCISKIFQFFNQPIGFLVITRSKMVRFLKFYHMCSFFTNAQFWYFMTKFIWMKILKFFLKFSQISTVQDFKFLKFLMSMISGFQKYIGCMCKNFSLKIWPVEHSAWNIVRFLSIVCCFIRPSTHAIFCAYVA